MQSVLLILVSMVLMPGIIAKTKALLSSRKGASILQPWFDIFKLLKKGSIFAEGSTFIFQIAPIIGSRFVSGFINVTNFKRFRCFNSL